MVTMHVVDWEADPESVGPDGQPADDALPDFVVLLSPDTDGPHRTNTVTFDPDQAHSS